MRTTPWHSPGTGLLLAALAAAVSADELLDDEELLTVRDHAPQRPPMPPLPPAPPSPGSAAAGAEGGGQQAAPVGMSDPMDAAVDLALQAPALFMQRLQVHFEETNKKEWLVINRGDIPAKILDAFATENGMMEDQKKMSGRALAKAQLELAWMSEESRREREKKYLEQPALFNLTLSVRQDEQSDATIPIPITQGQSPLEAVEAFIKASERELPLETAQKIAERLSDDQRNLAWEVAGEQFGPNATIFKYLNTRLQYLSTGELLDLADIATARRKQLELFTLFVECGEHCPAHASGPIKLTTFEGDQVPDLAESIAARAGKEGDEQFMKRVSGAILVAFHNYKTVREKLGVNENNTLETAIQYWYDERSDSFKEPRMWESAPPRHRPLFQLTYDVESPVSPEPEDPEDRVRNSVNVTIYEGDVAVDLGERLAKHYEIDTHAGWDFAHYVATSYRKVRAQLEIGVGARPWEEKPPDGMALFAMDVSHYDGVPSTAAPLVVHEGDGPKALARKCLGYYRQLACESKATAAANAAVASGEAEKLAVSTKVKEQCEAGDSDATDGGFALYVERVDALSRGITAKFRTYFERNNAPPKPSP